MTKLAIEILVAASLTLWVGACAAGDEPRPITAAPEPVDSELPPGTIKRGEDFYLVPIGPDHEGCMMYRTFSLTRMVTHVIYYDDGKGGYTANKNVAFCAEVE